MSLVSGGRDWGGGGGMGRDGGATFVNSVVAVYNTSTIECFP